MLLTMLILAAEAWFTCLGREAGRGEVLLAVFLGSLAAAAWLGRYIASGVMQRMGLLAGILLLVLEIGNLLLREEGAAEGAFLYTAAAVLGGCLLGAAVKIRGGSRKKSKKRR